MGLIAFCGFVLPWLALAAWLTRTQIKPYHTGVPWRPLTDYAAPGDHLPAPPATASATSGDGHPR